MRQAALSSCQSNNWSFSLITHTSHSHATRSLAFSKCRSYSEEEAWFGFVLHFHFPLFQVSINWVLLDGWFQSFWGLAPLNRLGQHLCLHSFKLMELYSMRLVNKMNLPRVLFCFKSNRICFLFLTIGAAATVWVDWGSALASFLLSFLRRLRSASDYCFDGIVITRSSLLPVLCWSSFSFGVSFFSTLNTG